MADASEAPQHPRPSADELADLRFFWQAFQGEGELRVAQLMMERLPHHELFARLAARQSPERQAADAAASRALQDAAITEGAWDPWFESLQAQGVRYVDDGLRFRHWYEITAWYQEAVVPFLVERFADDPAALTRAIRGMHVLINLALPAIAEAYLDRSNRALAEANEDLQRFATIASHDLRAPLRGILHLVEWIEEDLGDATPPTSAEYLRLLAKRVGRMRDMLDGLLTYHRAGRSTDAHRAVDLHEVVVGCMGMADPAGAFELHIEGDLPALFGPPAAIEHVVLNLLANAVRHHDREAGRVSVRAQRDGLHWRVEIADDGPGIEHRYHERVFEPFRTLKAWEHGGGAGMGLPAVRRTVRRHGGDLGLRSEPPARGTTFWFTWPVPEDDR